MKTYKKILSLLLAIMLIVTAVPVTASAETYGDLTYSVSGGEVKITGCSTTVTEVVIPETIDGYRLQASVLRHSPIAVHLKV